jgi:ketosteroid isomerase-like protein
MSQGNVNSARGVRYRVALPSEAAASRRTPDEHLFVRYPAVYRLLAALWMRLPPRSRLRRGWLKRLAGRALAAANRRDFAVLFFGMDPAVEFHPAGDQLPPGMEPVSRGHDEYEMVWRQMMDAFDDFRGEPVEIVDLGDKLLAVVEYKGHGSGSGVPVSIPLFQLFKLRRGLVIWQKDFSDRAEALEAAGLRE